MKAQATLWSPVAGVPPKVFTWTLRVVIAAAIINSAVHVFNWERTVWVRTAALPPYGDFFGLWTFGRFALSHGAQVYDPQALSAFQHTIAPAFRGFYPCPYPPGALLFFAFISLLPLGAALAVWMTGTFAAYVAATLGTRWNSIAGLALIAAPTSVVTTLDGQNGFLSGALLIGGLRYASTRPILSGVLFGLLTYKPQLGILVPVALLAGGYWRVILVAAATGVSLVLLSGTVFGWGVWVAWPLSLPGFTEIINNRFAHDAVFMPTITAGLRQLGAALWFVHLAQLGILAAVVIMVWRLCRHGLTERAIAAIPIATILAMPYAFTYDLPMVAAALVLEALRRQRLGIQTTINEVTVLVAGIAVLAIMTSFALPLAAPLLMSLMLWRIVAGPG